jgi:hypothetical protein
VLLMIAEPLTTDEIDVGLPKLYPRNGACFALVIPLSFPSTGMKATVL